MQVALTLAGTDPSGGAGIAADLMVMRDFGYHGALVVTSVIAQDTRGVAAAWPMGADCVMAQLERLLDDVEVGVIKIGVLGDAETAAALGARLRRWRAATGGVVVLDPVMRSGQNGASLGGEALGPAVLQQLTPCCDVVTPNAVEAEVLTGVEVRSADDAARAGRALVEAGARAALVKAGHIPGGLADVLVLGDHTERLPLARRYPFEVRGTGCHLSTALACALGRQAGRDAAAILDATRAARRYVDGLWASGGVVIGHGARVFSHAEAREGERGDR